MSMLDAARDAAAVRLGGATRWRDAMAPEMPDFGALPDLSAMPAPVQPPVKPSLADAERAEYAGLLKNRVVDENGMTKEGKMYRGPKARTFAAENGGWDFVMKDKNLAAELNRITIAENRELGGLPPLEQAAPQGASVDIQKAFPKPSDMSDETYQYHLGVLGKGKDAGAEPYKDSYSALNPQNSERAQKIQAAKDKQEKARKAKLKAMQLDFQFLPSAFSSLREAEKILDNQGWTAAGTYAGLIPAALNQGRADLKRYLDSIGAEELKKNVEALRSTSENGTLGMRLTQEEILKEIQRAGPLSVETSPDTLRKTIKRLRSRLSHEIGLSAKQLKDFDPAAYQEIGEFLKNDPENRDLYELYMKAGGDAPPTSPKRYKFNPATGDLDPIGG